MARVQLNESNASRHHPEVGAAAGDPYAANPLWSLAALLLGWAAATGLVPDIGYDTPGALAPAGLALAAGLLAAPAGYAFYRPMTILRVDHILLGGLFFWIVLDMVQGSYGLENASKHGVLVVINSIALFAAAMVLGAALVPVHGSRLRDKTIFVPGADFLFVAGLVCFGFGILRIMLSCKLNPGCVYTAFFSPRFASAWAHADIGSWDSVLHQLKYAGYLVLPLAVGLYHLEKRISWRVVLLATLGLLFLLTLIADGGRRLVGVVMASSMLTWLLLHRPVRLRHIVMLVGGVLIIILVMQAMLQWRDIGLGRSLQAGRSVSFTKGIYVDRNLYYFSMIPDVVPDHYPHTASKGVIYILTYPIPRAIYPDKPWQRGFPLPKVLGLKRGYGWVWMITAVGEFYLIGGYFALIIGGLLFGALAGLANRILYKPTHIQWALTYSLATMTLFVAVRSAQELTAIGFTVLVVWALWSVWRLLTEKEKSRRPSLPG